VLKSTNRSGRITHITKWLD